MKADQKNRLFILLAVFLMTGSLAAWTIWEKQYKSSYKGETIVISVADTSAIKKVSITQPNGEVVEIQKSFSNNVWKINNEYPIRPQLLGYLKFGLKKMEVKRPIQKSNKNFVIGLLKKNGISCDVYLEKEKRSFIIMTNPNDVNSSYFMEQGEEDPYIVYVPGVKGNLSNLLNLTSKDWRAREIFSSTPKSLQLLKVSYRDKKDDGFEIEYKNGGFKIHEVEHTDTMKLMKYLSIYNYLGADGFLDLDSLPIDLKKRTPDTVIELKDLDPAKNTVLKIYFIKELNKILGISDKSKEGMWLNPQVFKFVLINKKYFYAKH